MAHTKTGSAHRGNRDSVSKRLGVKLFGGQTVHPGNIIIRQKGSRFRAGDGVKMSSNFTLYAIKEGLVNFYQKQDKNYVAVKK